jgi:hypothetical protein
MLKFGLRIVSHQEKSVNITGKLLQFAKEKRRMGMQKAP